MVEYINNNLKAPEQSFFTNPDEMMGIFNIHSGPPGLIRKESKKPISTKKTENLNNFNILLNFKFGMWSNVLFTLDKYGDDICINISDENGFDLLYYAMNDSFVLNKLVTMHSSKINFSSIYNNGENVLTTLIRKKEVSIIETFFSSFTFQDLNHLTNNHESPLILASKLGLFSIVSLLIDSHVNLFFYDLSGYNAIMYCLNYPGEINHNICLKFISTLNPVIDYNIPFHKYNESSLEVLKSVQFKSKSNYSSFFYGIDKINNKQVMLKKCIQFNKYKILSPDIIKEIMFIRHLNSISNNFIRILGFFIDDCNFYLIFEPLAMTLLEYFSIIVNHPDKKSLIENIFYKLKEIIYEIHTNGILHNDLKLENIMFDYNGNLKIIDFGISDFFGLAPSKSVVKNYISSSYIKAPDTGSNVSFHMCDSNENPIEVFNFTKNRKSYCSDIYSFAVSIIQGIFCSTSKYIIIHNVFYKIVNSKDSSELPKLIPLSLNRIKQLEQYSFFEELKKMIMIDSNKRLIRPEPLSSIPLTYSFEEKNLLSNSTHYSSNDIKFSRNELIYRDQIVSNFKNKSLSSNSKFDQIKLLNSFLSTFSKNMCVDTVLNAIYHTNNYSGSFSKDIVFISFIFLYSSIFEWSSYDCSKIAEILSIDETEFIYSINSLILCNISIIEFIPFSSILSDKIINLQIENNENFYNIEKLLFTKIKKRITNVYSNISLEEFLSL